MKINNKIIKKLEELNDNDKQTIYKKIDALHSQKKQKGKLINVKQYCLTIGMDDDDGTFDYIYYEDEHYANLYESEFNTTLEIDDDDYENITFSIFYDEKIGLSDERKENLKTTAFKKIKSIMKDFENSYIKTKKHNNDFLKKNFITELRKEKFKKIV